MGNPTIRRASVTPPASPTGNGILTQVGGQFIADGSKQLPPPGPAEKHEPLRVVTIQVPHLDAVRITYQLNTYQHGRSRHWHWVATHAERVS